MFVLYCQFLTYASRMCMYHVRMLTLHVFQPLLASVTRFVPFLFCFISFLLYGDSIYVLTIVINMIFTTIYINGTAFKSVIISV